MDALLIAGPGFFLLARNVHWIFQRITEVTLHGYLNKYSFRSIYKICVRARLFSGLKMTAYLRINTCHRGVFVIPTKEGSAREGGICPRSAKRPQKNIS